jgi:hypothetical protein
MRLKILDGSVERPVGKPTILQIKGTLILRRRGDFYKITRISHVEGNWWLLAGIDLATRDGIMFESELLGMKEAMYTAAAVTTHGEDIWFSDMDNQGEGYILTRDQIKKIMQDREARRHDDQLRGKPNG